jgi:hypothetical protein
VTDPLLDLPGCQPPPAVREWEAEGWTAHACWWEPDGLRGHALLERGGQWAVGRWLPGWRSVARMSERDCREHLRGQEPALVPQP